MPKTYNTPKRTFVVKTRLTEEEHADGGVDRGGKAEDQEGGEELVVDVLKGLFEFGKHSFSFLGWRFGVSRWKQRCTRSFCL